MKKFYFILSLSLLCITTSFAQSPISVSLSGPSSASNNQTANYTLNTPYGTPSGSMYYWSCNSGTFSNGSSSLVTNAKTVSVKWTSTCSGQGVVSASLFASWPPSSAPLYYGSKTVSVPKGGQTPAQLQSQINSLNANVPAAYRCAAIMNAYNTAVNNNSCNYNYSGINLYGCQ